MTQSPFRAHETLSPAAAHFLTAIAELEETGQRVTTSALSKKLALAPASATEMFQRLARNRPPLIDYERYHGAILTHAGRKIAAGTVRRHRLLELYLTERLGYEWDQVGAEADQLEPVISLEFEEKITALLDNPMTDPHGDPIPDQSDAVPLQSSFLLSEAHPEQTVRVMRVRDEDPTLLRYLAEVDIRPRNILVIVAKATFDGPLTVSVGGRMCVLGRNVAEQIFVQVEEA